MSYLSKHNTLDDFSRYTLILSICSPIFLLFNTNCRVLIATNRIDYKFSTLKLLRILTLVSAFVVSTSLGISVLGWSYVLLFLVIAGYRGFDGIYEWSYGFFINLERADQVGRSQLMRSVALLIPILIAITGLVDFTITQFFTLVLLILIPLYIFSDRKLISDNYRRDSQGNHHSLNKLVSLGAPLGFMALADSLSVNIPKYGFEYFEYSELVGIYTSLFVFLQTMSYLSFSIVNSTLPSLKDYINRGVKEAVSNIISKSNLIMVGFSFLFIVGVYFIGKWLLLTFYTDDIALHSEAFFIFSFCVLPMKLSLVYSYALFCFNSFKKVLVVSLINALLITGLSFVLIPQLSLLGGILAFAIGQVFKMTCLFVLYRIEMKNLLPKVIEH